jgi:hypothetical protein
MHIYDDLQYIVEKPADKGQLYIYIIENYPQKNIKIGRTTNPVQRFRSLSGSNNGGNYIKRVAISPITYLYTLEKRCHIHFDQFRISGTEYFSDLLFEDAVEYLDDIFCSESYTRCNKIRKDFYDKYPEQIPNFLNKSSVLDEED